MLRWNKIKGWILSSLFFFIVRYYSINHTRIKELIITKQMNILFLDVDGVLNSEINKTIKKNRKDSTSSYHIKLPGDKLYKLKKIILATDAKIVLSSSWRLGGDAIKPSYAQLNLENQLENYGMSIFSTTPFEKNRDRGVEIFKWLELHRIAYGYVPNYVILDNFIDDLITYHKGHIVNIPEMVGLQNKHVAIAINLFKRQECFQ